MPKKIMSTFWSDGTSIWHTVNGEVIKVVKNRTEEELKLSDIKKKYFKHGNEFALSNNETGEPLKVVCSAKAIGKGTFGEVRIGLVLTPSRALKVVAIKIQELPGEDGILYNHGLTRKIHKDTERVVPAVVRSWEIANGAPCYIRSDEYHIYYVMPLGTTSLLRAINSRLGKQGADFAALNEATRFLDLQIYELEKRNLLHGDTKPANVILTQGDSTTRLKPIDTDTSQSPHIPCPDKETHDKICELLQKLPLGEELQQYIHENSWVSATPNHLGFSSDDLHAKIASPKPASDYDHKVTYHIAIPACAYEKLGQMIAHPPANLSREQCETLQSIEPLLCTLRTQTHLYSPISNPDSENLYNAVQLGIIAAVKSLLAPKSSDHSYDQKDGLSGHHLKQDALSKNFILSPAQIEKHLGKHDSKDRFWELADALRGTFSLSIEQKDKVKIIKLLKMIGKSTLINDLILQIESSTNGVAFISDSRFARIHSHIVRSNAYIQWHSLWFKCVKQGAEKQSKKINIKNFKEFTTLFKQKISENNIHIFSREAECIQNTYRRHLLYKQKIQQYINTLQKLQGDSSLTPEQLKQVKQFRLPELKAGLKTAVEVEKALPESISQEEKNQISSNIINANCQKLQEYQLNPSELKQALLLPPGDLEARQEYQLNSAELKQALLLPLGDLQARLKTAKTVAAALPQDTPEAETTQRARQIFDLLFMLNDIQCKVSAYQNIKTPSNRSSSGSWMSGYGEQRATKLQEFIKETLLLVKGGSVKPEQIVIRLAEKIVELSWRSTNETRTSLMPQIIAVLEDYDRQLKTIEKLKTAVQQDQDGRWLTFFSNTAYTHMNKQQTEPKEYNFQQTLM